MVSSSTLSTVRPPITECTPQELLPIMPPSVQYSCVDGIGREGEVLLPRLLAQVSSTQPGCTIAWRAVVSSSSTL